MTFTTLPVIYVPHRTRIVLPTGTIYMRTRSFVRSLSLTSICLSIVIFSSTQIFLLHCIQHLFFYMKISPKGCI